MKMAFVIHNEHYAKNVLELLKKTGIDYFTRWDNAVGKGHGTGGLGGAGHQHAHVLAHLGEVCHEFGITGVRTYAKPGQIRTLRQRVDGHHTIEP